MTALFRKSTMVVAGAANVPFQRLDAKKKSSPQTHRRSNKPSSSSNKSDTALAVGHAFRTAQYCYRRKRTVIWLFGTVPYS